MRTPVPYRNRYSHTSPYSHTHAGPYSQPRSNRYLHAYVYPYLHANIDRDSGSGANAHTCAPSRRRFCQ